MPSIPSTHPAAAFPSTFYERVKVDLLLLLLFVLATWNMLRVGLFNLQHLQLEHTEKEGKRGEESREETPTCNAIMSVP